MNFVRSRLSIGNFVGQRCRHVTETWSRRGMCNKPQEVKAEPLPAVPAQAPRPAFKIPGSRPSEMDRRFLIWSGRFKTLDQIPALVSHEMIDAARNNVRVKMCFAMMGISIGACVVMVILGKRASRRNESLTAQNLERKVMWRAEMHKQEEAAAAAAALSGKAQ